MVAGGAAVAIALLVTFGIERKGVHLGTGTGGEMHPELSGFAPQQAE
jgi:hypothetical protein